MWLGQSTLAGTTLAVRLSLAGSGYGASLTKTIIPVVNTISIERQPPFTSDELPYRVIHSVDQQQHCSTLFS